MFKNVAGQKWIVFAFQDEGGTNPGEPVTGDAANITGNLRLDGGAANAIDDLNPTELEDGYYAFDITQAESNADLILIAPASATANVNVIGVPGAVWTRENQDAALVDLIWDEPLTVPTHNVANSAGRRLRALQESGAVYAGFVWIDTVNGTAGTSAYENGTSDNPVDSIADANTLAAALGISRFMVAPGSSITFAATQANQEFHGKNWTLALGGQNIAGTWIEGATITGIATGADYHFFDCHIGNVTLADGDMHECSLDGTITISAAGDYRLDACYSGVAGAGATPIIDFGAAVANTNLNIRHYSGGLTINNKDATGTDLMSLEGNGQLIVSASSGGAIAIRGNFKVTNTGGATITYDDNADALANRLPAALVGGRMDANTSALDGDATAAVNLKSSSLGIVPGTAQVGSTTTIIETNLTEANNNVYIGRVIVFTSGDAAGEATDITDYDGTTKQLTVTALEQTPANGDNFVII